MLEAFVGYIALVAVAIGLAVGTPLTIQYVNNISGRMASTRNLEIQSSANVSQNMSHTSTNVTEEISRTSKQAGSKKGN